MPFGESDSHIRGLLRVYGMAQISVEENSFVRPENFDEVPVSGQIEQLQRFVEEHDSHIHAIISVLSFLKQMNIDSLPVNDPAVVWASELMRTYSAYL